MKLTNCDIFVTYSRGFGQFKQKFDSVPTMDAAMMIRDKRIIRYLVYDMTLQHL